MFAQQIRKVYDHLYANAAVKTPAAIGAEVGKLLHTALFIETVEGQAPAFRPSAFTPRDAQNVRGAFDRMNRAWDFYPETARIELTDFDINYASTCLAGILISDPHHDYFGDATEIFRSDWAKQAGGQFFTNQHVTRLAMTLLQFDPRPREGREGDDLVDICAGTGGFLLAGLYHIRKLVEQDADGERTAAALAVAALKGQEVDAEVAAIANASLKSRLGKDSAALVTVGDSLRRTDHDRLHDPSCAPLRDDSHMCVATNPPFGTKITIKDPDVLSAYQLAGGGSPSFESRAFTAAQTLTPRAPDILFLERNLRLLRPGLGRMAIVIPYQLLSGPQARFVREWLLRHGKVRAVIDLPPETFQPHTGTKASLVLVERRAHPAARLEDDHDIFFSTPRWIGHDRRGRRVYRRAPDKTGVDAATGDILTDFPDVAAAFMHFLAQGTPGTAHRESFVVNARAVCAEPSLRLNAAFYATRPAKGRGIALDRTVGKDWKCLSHYVARIFCPVRFKRHYVDPGPGAVPFFGGANISELLPTGVKWLARNDPKLRELRVEPGWILVTRSGSTGIVATVPAAWTGAALSEHVIRIVPDPEKVDPGYLLAVLRSDYGQAWLARGIFGSVIDEITPAYVGQMPVPPPEGALSAEVVRAVREAEAGRNQAMAGFLGAAALIDRAVGM